MLGLKVVNIVFIFSVFFKILCVIILVFLEVSEGRVIVICLRNLKVFLK